MTIDSFRRGFSGNALVPDEDGYDDARSVWNGDIDRRPAVIAQCRSAEEVVAALAFGRGEGLEIAVRGGGHNFAGHGVCEKGLMIDLSPMTTVQVDPGAKRARCGGGTTWAELDAATQVHGLATPGGVISHTGVGGLTLGGGIGWLSRKAGLSCDNLVAARVVTADGRIVIASADENPDLYWALRGGGGNFGVVTEFEFALHDVGPMVNLGLFFWGTEQGSEALRFARDYVASAEPTVGLQLIGLNAPPAPFVPEQYHFKPGYGLAVVGWGSPEEHAELVQPIRDTLPPCSSSSPRSPMPPCSRCSTTRHRGGSSATRRRCTSGISPTVPSMWWLNNFRRSPRPCRSCPSSRSEAPITMSMMKPPPGAAGDR